MEQCSLRDFSQQEEITMKRLMSIIAIAMALLGSANFALAQSNPSLGASTGSAANEAANAHDGEYFGAQ
jgi:hypothetical protein